jgi:hypothetical protein
LPGGAKEKSPCLDPSCPWKSQEGNFEKQKEREKDQGALVEVFAAVGCLTFDLTTLTLELLPFRLFMNKNKEN